MTIPESKSGTWHVSFYTMGSQFLIGWKSNTSPGTRKIQQTIKIVNVKHTCSRWQVRVSADRVMAVWALYLIWCTENAIVYFNQIFETSAHCQLDFALLSRYLCRPYIYCTSVSGIINDIKENKFRDSNSGPSPLTRALNFIFSFPFLPE